MQVSPWELLLGCADFGFLEALERAVVCPLHVIREEAGGKLAAASVIVYTLAAGEFPRAGVRAVAVLLVCLDVRAILCGHKRLLLRSISVWPHACG